MGHSQAEKAKSRERILEAAARQIREGGPDSVNVSRLMHAAELTHGGFYGHFASRSDLLAKALERALEAGEARAKSTSPGQDGPRGFAAFVRSYLSRAHRDAPGDGCAIAALVSDVRRADEASKAVMAEHIESFIASAGRRLGTGDEAQAITAVAAMIGALTLSR